MSPLIEIRDLVKTFTTNGGVVTKAVGGVSLQIDRGETLGIVGESGSGKSTLGRLILRLLEADSGEIRFDGIDMRALPGPELRTMRSRIQIVFQDPYTSLNRRHTVGQIVEAPLRAHGPVAREERRAAAARLLDLVQLPSRIAQRHPGDLSGGQAQRVAIARALALSPEFVVLDEAVSALDASVRAQVLNLLADLQGELGLTYLFISHDMGVVRHSCHRVAVMQHGMIVEQAGRLELFDKPRHPYTRELLDAVPIPDPEVERSRLRALRGQRL